VCACPSLAFRVETLRELAMASTILPKQFAIVLSESGIVEALGLTGKNSLEVSSLARQTKAIAFGGDFILPFTEVIPARVLVDVTPDGTTAKTSQELAIVAAEVVRETPPEKARRTDPARPFLIAVAAMIASSVAILVATFATLTGKDAPAGLGGTAVADVASVYQAALGEVMMWMAATIAVATVAALLLQGIRMLWLGPGKARGAGAFWCAVVVSFAISLAPAYYGWFAAKAAVSGAIVALKIPAERVPKALAPFRD
jgi:hypothetical protein